MTTSTEYALMAGASYISTRPADGNKFPVPNGWLGTKHENPQDGSGFEAISFINGATLATSTNIVISYAGTDPDNLLGPDIAANIGLATGAGSAQLVQAVDYYLQVKALNPTATITFTGHSLGGGLAALMGVFFNQPAVTFDQAPFANSATTAMRDQLIADLLALKDANNQPLYTQQQLTGLAPEFMSPAFDPASRTGNVSTYRVDGEFTSTFPIGTLFSPIGTPTLLQHGPTDVAGTDLHSQALLTAFLQSNQSAASGTNPQQTLSQATTKLTSLLRLMFDNNLYAFPTSKADKNFIENLVRHEAGVRDPVTGAATIAADAMVTRFTADMWKLAQDGGLTMPGNLTDMLPGGTLLQPIRELLNKALIVFAMQKYYDENQGSIGVGETLYKDVSGGGGIRFDFKAIAASWDKTKDAEKTGYFNQFLDSSLFTAAERTLIKSFLPYMRDWYVQAGASGMNATDSLNRGAFMLGGTGQDILTGGTFADLLVGNAGDDILSGGQGSDTLIGGTGVDTYVLNSSTGQGIDTLLDSDNTGYLRDDTPSTSSGQAPIVITGGAQYGDNKVFRGTDANGVNHLYTFVTGNSTTGGDLIVDGAMLIKNYNPNTGTLVGSAAQDVLTGGAGSDLLIAGAGNDDIVGDNDWVATSLNWTVTDLADGTRYFYPTNGNPATSGAADVIYAGDGNDHVWGQFGNDVIFGEAGADKLYGGEGNDIILGGAGIDYLYGDAGSATAQTSGNDYLDGGDNTDYLYGGAGDDIIVGGTENDTLYGGTGQDTYIFNRGDGNDTVYDIKGENNILRFGAGISSNDITLRLGSLMLDLGNGDAIHLKNMEHRPPTALEVQAGHPTLLFLQTDTLPMVSGVDRIHRMFFSSTMVRNGSVFPWKIFRVNSKTLIWL